MLSLCAVTTDDGPDREEKKAATTAQCEEKAARGQGAFLTVVELRKRSQFKGAIPCATSAEGLSLAWMYRAYRR
jgi:hypothetical protein